LNTSLQLCIISFDFGLKILLKALFVVDAATATAAKPI